LALTMHPYVAVPAIALLLLRAWSNHSLTPLGLLAAGATASIHALHPWSAPVALLAVFFLGGTAVTKVRHDKKATLTLSSAGSSGAEGPRTHIQVLANSLCASILILLHVYNLSSSSAQCLRYGGPSLFLTVGIVSNYAATAADTFSSELGILSKSQPRLITTLRKVPPGTNGGVTAAGLLAGALGSFTVAVTSVLLLPFCPKSSGPVGRVLMATEYRGWGIDDKILWIFAITLWGFLGSVLDSFLGAILQASVIDSRTGKVVEGSGGQKVLVKHTTNYGVKIDGAEMKQNSKEAEKHEESRRILSGTDLLDNNQINFLMAAIMSVGGMALASYLFKEPLSSMLSY